MKSFVIAIATMLISGPVAAQTCYPAWTCDDTYAGSVADSLNRSRAAQDRQEREDFLRQENDRLRHDLARERAIKDRDSYSDPGSGLYPPHRNQSRW